MMNNISTQLYVSTTTTAITTTLNDQHQSKDDRTLMNTLIIISYSLIIIISIFGNILVSKIIISNPKMKNPTNILILVLSMSDLFMTILNIPFTVIDIILNDWIFGQFICIFVSFFQAYCVYVSSFTMVLIAIHRYRCVSRREFTSRPRRSNLKKWLGLSIAILLVLILAAIAAMPHTIYAKVRVENLSYYGSIRLCRPSLPKVNFNLSLWITLETLMTQYIIPMSLVGLFYVRIGIKIHRQGRVGQITEERNRQLTYKKRRRIIMLGLVVAIFALCWLPFNIYYLLVDFNLMHLDFRIFLFCHWFAMSSVCYNPFIYCWFNESFRKEAKIIGKLLKLFHSTNNSENSDNSNNSSHSEDNQQENSLHHKRQDSDLNSARITSLEALCVNHVTSL